MSKNLDPTRTIDPALDACGCCEDLPNAPERFNRPGLPEIHYRLGTYGTFMSQLIAQLTRPALPGRPTLEALKTRRLDDGTIALLDAWSVVADVLTFYQERIVNENYLRTATERRSVLELARAIGYELNPGVAASTYLAFTVDASSTVYNTSLVPAGTQVQSLPEQQQLPQTFETSDDFTARAEWNNLQAPQTKSYLPGGGDRALYLAGINTRLDPGDWLLIVGEERTNNPTSQRWQARRLLTVESDVKENYTYVTWSEPLTSSKLPDRPQVYAFRTRANIYGHNAQDWRSLPDVAKATYLGLSDPSELVLADKREWPAYTIFAPQSGAPAGTVIGPVIEESGPTPQFVAAAVRSAIGRETNRAKNRMMATASQIPNDVLAVFRATETVLDDVLSSVNHILSESVNGLVNSARTIVDGSFSSYTAISGLFTQIIDNVQLLVQGMEQVAEGLSEVASSTDSDNEDNDFSFSIPDVIETVSNVFAPDSDAAPDTVSTLRTAVASIENSPIGIVQNFAQSLEDFFDGPAGLADDLLPDSLTNLSGAITTLEQRISGDNETSGLVQAASEALGIFTAGQIIDLAVETALQAPRPLPPPTAQSIAQVATDFAEVAVVMVSEGPEAAAVLAASSSVVGAAIGASIFAFDTVVEEGADIGATNLRKKLVGDEETEDEGAIAKALKPIETEITPATERRHFAQPDTNAIDLDTIYPKITPDSWVLLSFQNNRQLYQVASLVESARSDFGLSGKTTRLTLSGPELDGSVFEKAVRGTLVYGESDVLALAERPLSDPIAGKNIDIEGLVELLLPGAPLAVSGKVMRAQVGEFEQSLALAAVDNDETKALPAGAMLWVEALPVQHSNQSVTWTLRDVTGFVGTVTASSSQIAYAPALESDDTVSEVAFLQSLPTFNPTTHLQLQEPLKYVYDRSQFSINANVVACTHGETVSAVLGSGNGAESYQTFTLKKPPLTYVSSSSPSGQETTLSVRVNNILWAEASAFYGLKPTDENYIVRLEDDGTTKVIFGDSQQGARLPTGTENVVATYRSGIGLIGEVDSGRLTLLKQRPLGIQSVTNPVSATGAEDPENLETARDNAPLTVLTLDRIVSRQDYGDFARAFAGIGKAQAIEIWDGVAQQVHITIAAANGHPVEEDSQTYENLEQAINRFRDPGPYFSLNSFVSRSFNLKARLKLNERYVPEQIITAVTALLLETFSFEHRAFGQGVSAAEVIALIQSVTGVVAVDLDLLYRSDRTESLETFVGADIARWDATQSPPVIPSELLLINPLGIELEVIAS